MQSNQISDIVFLGHEFYCIIDIAEDEFIKTVYFFFFLEAMFQFQFVLHKLDINNQKTLISHPHK